MKQTLQARTMHIPIDDAPLSHWNDSVRGRLSWRTLISSDRASSDSVVCGLAYFDAGGEEKLHHHAPAQLVHVIEGYGRAVVSNRKYSLTPGDTIFIPGNTLHSFHASKHGMTIIFLFSVDSIDDIEYVFSDEQMVEQRRVDMRSSPTRVPIDDAPMERWDDPVHGCVSWRTLISADRSSSDSLICGMAYFDASGELKAHRHTPSEVFHVLSGEGTAVIDGREYPMAASDTLFVPGHSVHSFRANEDGMKMLFFFGVDSFADIEYFFEQTS